MTAESLMKRFSMTGHVENGAFVEKHYEHSGADRAKSGLIYYYVAPDERTEFHVIDCDEYWCYSCGSTLEIWTADEAGELSVHLLGTEECCEPAVYLRSGLAFASKHPDGAAEGTFLSCITVPRFSYEGFTLIPEKDMVEKCPAAAAFFGKKGE